MAPRFRAGVAVRGAALVLATSAGAGDTPSFVPDLEHVPAGVAGYDGFGVAVDWLDDATIVVGAPGDDTGGDEAGAIWVLGLDLTSGAVSVDTATRIAGGIVDAQFGESVATVAGLIAVGSPLEDGRRGAVRLVNPGSGEIMDLAIGDVANARFGASLDSAGDRLVIGVPGQGLALVRQIVDAAPIELGTIASPDGAGDRFGAAVTLAADGRVAIGAPGFDGDRGRVHVYAPGKKGWIPVAVLEGVASGDRFGESVRFCGDRLAVGAPGSGAGDAGSGRVYGSDLDPAMAIVLESHGYETGIRLDYDEASGLLAVGSTGQFYAGGVRLHRISEVVEPVGDLRPAVGFGQYELFGLGLGIRNGVVAAGSPFRDGTAGPYAGACFLAGTGVDCDGDLVEDAWETAAGFESDCNGNGAIDTCDITDGSSEDRDFNGIPDECQDVVVLEVPTPYATINAALAVARDGDEVLVRPGNYNEHVDFAGRAIVVESSDGPQVTTLDGTGLEGSIVTAVTGETSGSVLRGFTIAHGRLGTPFPENPAVRVGGGVFAYFASPTIESCIFRDNYASFGAGAYLYEWDGEMTSCVFEENEAAADGGALQLSRCDGSIQQVTFNANQCVRRGGAVHVFNGSPTMQSCVVTGNTAGSEGGGVSFASNDGTPVLLDSEVRGNLAEVIGGGIFIDEDTLDPEIGGTTVCENDPEDIFGGYTDLGGNQVCFCQGDLNLDGEISAGDLGLLLANWSNGQNFPQGDLNGDGEITAGDLGIMLALFGPCL